MSKECSGKLIEILSLDKSKVWAFNIDFLIEIHLDEMSLNAKHNKLITININKFDLLLTPTQHVLSCLVMGHV